MGEAAAKKHEGEARPERRRHRVYVTRNTEYHFRDGFCVAVRDRRSGDFLPGHLAIRRRLHGGLKFFHNGAIVPNAYLVGVDLGLDNLTNPTKNWDYQDFMYVLSNVTPA